MGCETVLLIIIITWILDEIAEYIAGWVFSLQLLTCGVILIIHGREKYNKNSLSGNKQTKPLLIIWGGIAMIIFVAIRTFFVLKLHG